MPLWLLFLYPLQPARRLYLSFPPPPTSGCCPGRKQGGRGWETDTSREREHKGYSQAFRFPAAPWLASDLGKFFRRYRAPPSSFTKTETKQKPTQISVTSSFLTSSQEVIELLVLVNYLPNSLAFPSMKLTHACWIV